MRLPKAVSAATFIALMTCVSCGEPEFTRNTALYAQPPIIVLNPVGPPSHYYQQDEKRVRDSIWEYWTKRQRALIRVTARNKDQPPVTRAFYIEPDVAGHWSVAIETDYDELDPASHTKMHKSIRMRAYSVHRVAYETHKDSDEYGLVFYDQDDMAILTLR